MRETVILSAIRTPVGSFRGSLASVSATKLGSIAASGAIQSAKLKPQQIQEVFFGHVNAANCGQAPAAQAARGADIPVTVSCTGVNKVCASGLKAVMLGSQSIQLGHQDIVLAGGMESMSNAPFYLDKARSGFGYGHHQVLDSILKDGLTDAQYHCHMGVCGDETAKKFDITREQQDDFAISSYKKAAEAVKTGVFKKEIVPVTVTLKKKEVVISEDEEYKNVNFDKTAANASTLNDGASAVVLASSSKAKELGLTPIARILGFADANRDPKEFTIAPADAIPKALKMAGKSLSDISLFEINEAFSVVVLANNKILGLDPSKVNIAGGGVSLGHPIGSSGCRILVTLVHLLKKGQIGCAAICNGGGGASALVVEKL